MENKKRESVQKLNDLIKGIKVAMLTTNDGGVLRSRPMQTQNFEFDGDLWFFTSSKAHKTEEIEKDNRVNAAYSAPESNTYVSVSGTAEIVRDRAKIDEYWNDILKAWFPEGKDSPDLVLLRVAVEEAEYWDSPSSTIVQIAGFVKALATGERAEGGENRKISL
ncbi:MAG: pyridoxamine 5'-phosphate oxidase family protein [Acidobacteriota bacterium]|nr:pyridoxamine 5'-phosphate oxidase family protein [Acidobacteriota bacterium]